MPQDEKTPAKGKVTLVKEEIGVSGTVLLNGLISDEEYNRDLQGKEGLEVYDEMRRADGQVRAALLVCKLPIISTDWGVRPYSQDSVDIETADFIEDQLFNRLNWKSHLREALTMFDFGHAVYEVVLEPVVFEGKTFIGLKKLGFRKQNTIYAWETVDHQPGITQSPANGNLYNIPREKLLIYTHEQEGENYEGISLLRAAYKHWYYKNEFYKIEAIQKERQGVGIPQLTYPSNASEPDKAKARKIAKNLRANEEAYNEMPEGFTLEFMDMHANTVSDTSGAIAHHNRQILMSVLAQFLDLGAKDSGGAYALSEDQSRLFISALEAEADNIVESLTKDLIKKLVELNFGSSRNVPELYYESLGTPDIKNIAESVGKLKETGLIKDDFQTEQYLRGVLSLPLLDEDDAAMEELMEEIQMVIDDLSNGTITVSHTKEEVSIKPQTAAEPEEGKKKKKPDNLDNDNDEPAAPPTPVENAAMRKLKNELIQFALDLQVKITQMRAKGQEINKQQVGEMRVQLFTKRRDTVLKMNQALLKARAPQNVDDALIIAQEQLANVENLVRERG